MARKSRKEKNMATTVAIGSTVGSKYLVFFKARDADALTAAFTEYSGRKAKNKDKPSVIKMLRALRAPEIAKDNCVGNERKKAPGAEAANGNRTRRSEVDLFIFINKPPPLYSNIGGGYFNDYVPQLLHLLLSYEPYLLDAGVVHKLNTVSRVCCRY